MGLYLDRRSGKWGVDVRVPPNRTGHRIRRLVGAKDEARAVEADLIVQGRQGKFPILKSPTAAPSFAEVAVRYVREYPGRDTRTIRLRVGTLAAHFTGRTLDQTTTPAIRSFISSRVAGGTGPATCNRYRATLSAVLSWAIDSGIWSGPHPLLRGAPGRVKPLREPAGRERYLNHDEAARLLAAADPPLKQMIVLALCSGMRAGEIMTLLWADVRDGAIHLRGEVCKSGRSRVIPLIPVAVAALDSLPRDGDRVFASFRRFPRHQWVRAVSEAGLSGLHFHDCRHSFASRFVMNGGDLYRLKNYLGHSTIKLTERYSHASPAYLLEGVRYIGDGASEVGGRSVDGLPPAYAEKPYNPTNGGMAEWFKAAVLKTVGGNPRRFESCSLRHRPPLRCTDDHDDGQPRVSPARTAAQEPFPRVAPRGGSPGRGPDLLRQGKTRHPHSPLLRSRCRGVRLEQRARFVGTPRRPVDPRRALPVRVRLARRLLHGSGDQHGSRWSHRPQSEGGSDPQPSDQGLRVLLPR